MQNNELRKIDYQILCKILGKEMDNQKKIINSKTSSRTDIAEAIVFLRDVERIYKYFEIKRNASNDSIYAKFLHIFRKILGLNIKK